MIFIDLQTRAYPLFIGDLVDQTGLPPAQAAVDPRYAVVHEVPLPEIVVGQIREELAPELGPDGWVQRFSVRDETDEELKRRLENEAYAQKRFEQLFKPPSSKSTGDANGTAPDVIG